MESKPIVIAFPLQGEWQAPTTPATKIPSHGTNRMGLRYAIDFLQINWENKRYFHDVNALRYLTLGVPLEKCYCWEEEIYAPCDGEIVKIVDGIPERKTVHWLRDSLLAIKNGLTFNENKHDFRQIAGNYIVMKCGEGIYMAFAHLQTHSIAVSLHQKVKKGTCLAKIGHSGNSTSPHLHFQVMDSQDIASAHGIPCLFEQYDIYEKGIWKTVYNQIPSSIERIRFYK